jgi:hypothetical protein
MSPGIANDHQTHESASLLPPGSRADKILNLWTSLPETDKDALLPRLLLRSANWRSLDKTSSARIVDNWFLVLFHRAKLNFWE